MQSPRLSLFALLCAAAGLWGQTVSGDPVGTVLDQTGAAVANAAVTATNTATDIRAEHDITERLHLQLSGQALNLFNHPQYIAGTPDAAQLPNNFSIFTPGVRSYVTASATTFNNPVLTFSSNPRTMLVVVKRIW